MTEYFIQAFIYLAAAVIAVPLAKRFGLGSVLGYLVAGVVIGPVTGLVGQETTTIQHFAEFGVVMMLFLVGMELDPKSLWAMRVRLLGLGGLQVVLTSLAGMAIAWSLGLAWQTTVAVGLIFSLSSTAIVLQTLNEKGLNKTEGGRSAFSVLLFQDIAVIPMLAVIPLLAVASLAQIGEGDAQPHGGFSLVANLPDWAHALVVVGAVAVVIVGGHYLSRPLFRYVVQSGMREVFTAMALMLVIGIAALMSVVNLSPALGAFLAGVVLANSEFRHELEANIEPFKGLLLGLFFITVGAGINFEVLSAQWPTVLTLGLLVIAVKAGVLLLLALVVAIDDRDRALALVHQVKQHYPGVWVLARAFDRGHAYDLRAAGADNVVSETYHSALELGGEALTAFGVHPLRARPGESRLNSRPECRAAVAAWPAVLYTFLRGGNKPPWERSRVVLCTMSRLRTIRSAGRRRSSIN